MGLFGFLKIPDINQGVQEFQNADGAVLLDVRDREEYSSGHIPGAVNIPRDEISEIQKQIPERNTRLFVYCYSGRRSDLAVISLKKMGYQNAKNIGGISSYKGTLEK